MAAPYFYHHPLVGASMTLSREESAHAGRSRRLRVGDRLILVDGRGGAADARVREWSGDRLVVEVGAVRHEPPTVLAGLTLVTALPRGKRQDFLFEKCTELGVGRIVATNFERSVVRAQRGGICGWTRTCREAMKQSRQSWMPRTDVGEELSGALDQLDDEALRLVAMPAEGAPALHEALRVADSPRAIWAVVGPEGGFTDEESALLSDHAFLPVRLAESVLRIETACVTLSSQILAGPC